MITCVRRDEVRCIRRRDAYSGLPPCVPSEVKLRAVNTIGKLLRDSYCCASGVLGADHPDTLISRNNLAADESAGRLAEAIQPADGIVVVIGASGTGLRTREAGPPRPRQCDGPSR
jgi:hypothetical protein